MTSPAAPAPSRIVILAAIDQTATSDDVLRTSAVLGQTLGRAELHLVHIVDPGAGALGRDGILPTAPQLFQAGRDLLAAVAERAQEHFSGKIVSHLAVGTPWREILQLAANLHTDVIVVGSHRRKTVERWLIGSVSEQIVRKASCAVLVARPKDYRSDVPEIEPACTDCLATQKSTDGEKLWCERHARRHVHGKLHYELPASFAVGSSTLRPNE